MFFSVVISILARVQYGKQRISRGEHPAGILKEACVGTWFYPSLVTYSVLIRLSRFFRGRGGGGDIYVGGF